jgi:hydrogenase nickel incorporation protein HypA/HybF
MHELGLAEGVLDVVLEAAGGAPVRAFALRVGDLQAVDEESFGFAFALVAEGTPASAATIAIERVPTRVGCRSCGAERPGGPSVGLCPVCGSADVDLRSGDEMTVTAVELVNGVRVEATERPATGPAGATAEAG